MCLLSHRPGPKHHVNWRLLIKERVGKIAEQRNPFYQIIVPVGLRPPETLVSRLRCINHNIDTQCKQVFRHPRVYTQKYKMMEAKSDYCNLFSDFDRLATFVIRILQI